MLTPCLPGQRPRHSATAPCIELSGLIAIFGAGEGIRTLDPNLGKVVLYP